MLARVKKALTNYKALGLRGALTKVMWYNEAKNGILVGTDAMGNKYFEEPNGQYGRDRWVEYSNYRYDASQVPPEWHSWLHHISDLPGPQLMEQYNKKWVSSHSQNVTGTAKAYTPPNFLFNSRNATKKEFEEWIPSQSKTTASNSL